MSSPFKASRFGSLCALFLSLVVARPASAQCGPDGLDLGACCQLINANLPGFIGQQLPGLGITWNNCMPVQQANLVVDVSTPTLVRCGQYQANVFVRDVNTNIMLLTGTMTLDYTRTWQEVHPSGVVDRVWRFAAKADLKVATLGVPPLTPIPNCIAPFGPHQTAFFYGYMDWSGGCTGTPPRNALVLYHANDFFIHNPALSDKPGAFHASRAYAIVAPHNTAQFFIPANQFAPAGAMFAEATRDVPPSTLACVVEDRVVSGFVNNFGAACLCSFTTTPQQHNFRQIAGKTACVNAVGQNGNFQSLALSFPTLPWFHMTSTSIGFWTNPNIYPGTESAWVEEGLFLRQVPCQGDFVGIYYGGSTDGGMTPLLPIPVVADGFVDIADNYTAPVNGPYPFPILGSIRPTDHLIYVNVP